jgi:hypothetical protein
MATDSAVPVKGYIGSRGLVIDPLSERDPGTGQLSLSAVSVSSLPPATPREGVDVAETVRRGQARVLFTHSCCLPQCVQWFPVKLEIPQDLTSELKQRVLQISDLGCRYVPCPISDADP